MTTRTVPLPSRNGQVENYRLDAHPPLETETGPPRTRRVYSNVPEDHCCMMGDQEGARSIVHRAAAELVRLLDAACLLPDTDAVARRLFSVLATAGIS